MSGFIRGPQIPSLADIVQAARDKLAALRPRAGTDAVLRSELTTGRYGDILAGWGAQARLNRDRLASEVVATRLPLADGKELRDLARSEFWAEFDETPGAAIGDVVIARSIINGSQFPSPFTIGVIPAGTRFRKIANQTASPPVAEAVYATTTTTTVDNSSNLSAANIGGGQWRHDQSVVLRVVAQSTGLAANTPFVAAFGLVDPLFDPLFKPSICLASGGVDGFADETVRSIARANYLGQFGPTEGALIAKTLGELGVQHVAVAQDPLLARTVMYVADGSWACGISFLGAVQQKLRDTVCGFGCRVDAGLVTNVAILVKATVVVEDAASLGDTTEIKQAIEKRLRSYFDDRPDWPVFRNNSIGAAISGAHPKILSCTFVQVRFAGSQFGISEPAAQPPLGAPFSVTHFYMADNATDLTFVAPS